MGNMLPLVAVPEHMVEDKELKVDFSLGDDPPQAMDRKCRQRIEMPYLWKGVECEDLLKYKSHLGDHLFFQWVV